MDQKATDAVEKAEKYGEVYPTLHPCRKCGQETLNLVYCDDCVEKLSKSLVDSGRMSSRSEAVEALYDLEVDAWYASRGY